MLGYRSFNSVLSPFPRRSPAHPEPEALGPVRSPAGEVRVVAGGSLPVLGFFAAHAANPAREEGFSRTVPAAPLAQLLASTVPLCLGGWSWHNGDTKEHWMADAMGVTPTGPVL
ncbi:hypothetical protein FKM82_019699 [Ascaphus truei]